MEFLLYESYQLSLFNAKGYSLKYVESTSSSYSLHLRKVICKTIKTVFIAMQCI
jgi:hypothetical protein